MKMRSCTWGIVALSVVGLTLTGCRTAKDVMNDYERALVLGNYAEASVEPTKLAADEDGTRLMWQLDAAAAHYMAGNRSMAIAMFDRAEDTFSQNDRVSVFAQGAESATSMMLNDKSFSYDGGGQDRIFTCLYKAIDYMAGGNFAAARTELNRADQHQENWIHERRKDIVAAQEKMTRDANAYEAEQMNGRTTVPAGGSANRDEQVNKALGDASLSAQIREKTGFDPATSGDLETMSRAAYWNRYAEEVRKVFRKCAGDSGAVPKDHVWIFVEDGLCPCREEWRVDLPMVLVPFAGRYVIYAGMALPYLRYRDAAAGNYSVQTDGKTIAMPELADIDKLTKTEFDVYMRGALAREITRVIVKTGVQAALGITADNVSDKYTKIALKSSQVAAAAWAASTTAADLRSWTALPKKVYAVSLSRPADGKLTVMAGNQQIQMTIAQGNTLIFIRKPSVAANPMIKQITFAK